MAQKQALCMFVATWVKAFCSGDDKDGFTLADALVDQVKLYLDAKQGRIN